MHVCAHHPERPAHAICVACRNPICQECSTRWEGIHYCVRCLEARRGTSRSRTAVGGWLVVAGAVIGLFFATNALRVLVGVIFGGWF